MVYASLASQENVKAHSLAPATAIGRSVIVLITIFALVIGTPAVFNKAFADNQPESGNSAAAAAPASFSLISLLEVQVGIDGRNGVPYEWQDEDEYAFAIIGESMTPVEGGAVVAPPLPEGSDEVAGMDNAGMIVLDSLDTRTPALAAKTFGWISFTEPGLYRYIVRELNPAECDVKAVPGVSYTSDRYEVDITLAYGAEGDPNKLGISSFYVRKVQDNGVAVDVLLPQGENGLFALQFSNAYEDNQVSYAITARDDVDNYATSVNASAATGAHRFVLRPNEANVDAPLPQAPFNPEAGVGLQVGNSKNDRAYYAMNVDSDILFAPSEGIRFTAADLGDDDRKVFLYDVSEVIPACAVHMQGTSYWRDEFGNIFDGSTYQVSVVVSKVERNGRVYLSAEEGEVPTFDNSQQPATAVTALCAWNDNGDQDAMRPQSVTLTLLANGEPAQGLKSIWGAEIVADQVLSSEDAMMGAGAYWADLPQFKEDGTPIVYSVDETAYVAKDGSEGNGEDFEGDTAAVDFYGKAIAQDPSGAFIVTNTHVPATASLEVLYRWVDQNNANGLRANAALHLYRKNADGSLVLATEETKDVAANVEGDGWSSTESPITWQSLPVYDQGQHVQYVVMEDVPVGYCASYRVQEDAGLVAAMANTLITQADAISQSCTQEAGANHVASTALSTEGASHILVTNTLSIQPIDVSAVITWNDADNAVNRPASVNVELVRQLVGVDADWQSTGSVVTLTAKDDWKADRAFPDLPTVAQGPDGAYHQVQYAIVEQPVDGYAIQGTTLVDVEDAVIAEDGSVDTRQNSSFAIQNDWAPVEDALAVQSSESVPVSGAAEPSGVPVLATVKWTDVTGAETDPTEPPTTLYLIGRDATNVVRYMQKSEAWQASQWVTSWSNTPVAVDGASLNWSVTENVPAGWKLAGTAGTIQEGFTLTNARVSETEADCQTNVKVMFYWDDDSNSDRTRKPVKLRLEKRVNGQWLQVGSDREITDLEADTLGFTWTFEDLYDSSLIAAEDEAKSADSAAASDGASGAAAVIADPITVGPGHGPVFHGQPNADEQAVAVQPEAVNETEPVEQNINEENNEQGFVRETAGVPVNTGTVPSASEMQESTGSAFRMVEYTQNNKGEWVKVNESQLAASYETVITQTASDTFEVRNIHVIDSIVPQATLSESPANAEKATIEDAKADGALAGSNAKDDKNGVISGEKDGESEIAKENKDESEQPDASAGDNGEEAEGQQAGETEEGAGEESENKDGSEEQTGTEEQADTKATPAQGTQNSGINLPTTGDRLLDSVIVLCLIAMVAAATMFIVRRTKLIPAVVGEGRRSEKTVHRRYRNVEERESLRDSWESYRAMREATRNREYRREGLREKCETLRTHKEESFKIPRGRDITNESRD